jgi:hypothetical protein
MRKDRTLAVNGRGLLRPLGFVGMCVLSFYGAIYALFMIGGGHHRHVERRLTSPDGRYQVRLQNDVRGSIQPSDWRVYVKPAAQGSDAPQDSCEVAHAEGEEVWQQIEPHWSGKTLVLTTREPSPPTLTLAAAACSPIPVRISHLPATTKEMP